MLVHEPGLEVDHMVPAAMDELLFDDVLYGDRAREEHALFRRALQVLGVEPVDAFDLLSEVVEGGEGRAWVLDLLGEDLPPEVAKRMRDAPGEELAAMLTTGVRAERAGVEVDELFAVPPLPNWCFQRDPQVLLANGVVFGAMAAPARQPEAVLSRAIFRFHPAFGDVPVLHDPLEDSPDRHPFVERDRPRLEGGDVLVLSDDVVVIGLSERTNRTAVQALARCLARVDAGPRWLVGVELPSRRAYMHLDTVMTVVDRDAVLVYPPVVTGSGPERATAFSIDLRARDLAATSEDGVLEALRRRGHDLEPIACGGADPLRQQREQWTDGANALALAPGVILLYERNVATTEELSRHAFSVVKAEDLVLGREEVDPDGGGRVCLVVPSHELSRARGGPHCLTHPLERDAV